MKWKSVIIISAMAVASFIAAPRAGATTNLPVYAYVSLVDCDSVAIIDTASDTVAATVAVGRQPFGGSANPDGSRAYIANSIDDTVSVIDGATKTVIATIPVSREPLGVGVSPDGEKVFVACAGGFPHSTGRLEIINATSNVVIGGIDLTNLPAAAAVTANGSHVYVACIARGAYVIDATTFQVVDQISIPGGGESIALSPRNPFGYIVNVTGPSEGDLGGIGVINVAGNKFTSLFTEAGQHLEAVVVSPDGKKIYATEIIKEEVVVLSALSGHVIQRIPLPGSNCVGISLTPDGRKAYVAGNAQNAVIVIDTTSNTVLTNIPVACAPTAIGQFIGTRLPD